MNRNERRQRDKQNRIKHAGKPQNIRGQPASIVVSCLLSQALQQSRAGALKKAAETCRHALKITPEHTDALYLHGMICLEMGKAPAAVKSLKKAHLNAPNNVDILFGLGTAYLVLESLDVAATYFQKAIDLNPNIAKLHNNLGNVFFELGRLEDSILSYEQAIRLQPDYANAYNNFGVALKSLNRPDEALVCFQKALSLEPANADGHINLGNILSDLNQPLSALDSYRQAVTLAPNRAEAHRHFGNTLHELGRIDSAIESYRQALALEPGHAETHRYLATAKTFSAKDNELKAMQALYRQRPKKEADRMHLAFALGKAYEDLGRYEAAFDHYLVANKIRRKSISFSIENETRKFQRIQQVFSKAFLDAHGGAGFSDAAPIFILGMPRSGTTLVEQILASHPRVFGAGELEVLQQTVTAHLEALQNVGQAPAAFDISEQDITNLGLAYYHKTKALMGAAEIVTDKMPANFQYIGLIKLMLPNARIVHCRRDPYDTCLSLFKNYFSTSAIGYAYDLEELGQYYRLYQDLMDHWNSVLPGFIHDLHYEDLISNQEQQTRDLLTFCGLEWNTACLEFHKSKRPVRTASATQVRRALHTGSVRSWTHYEHQLAPLFEAMGAEEAQMDRLH